jgi:hypothetical protein
LRHMVRDQFAQRLTSPRSGDVSSLLSMSRALGLLLGILLLNLRGLLLPGNPSAG